MRVLQIHRASGLLLIALSLTALLAVLSGYLQPAPQAKAREHISCSCPSLLLAPTLLTFLLTAEWSRPLHVARAMAIPASSLVRLWSSLLPGVLSQGAELKPNPCNPK